MKAIMSTQGESQLWSDFQTANRYRRAVREFSDNPIPEHDVLDLLTEASLAPSSGNMQPYQFHWIRDSALKTSIASACNGQKSAATAKTLIVVVASPALGLQTAMSQLRHVESAAALAPNSKAYYRKQIGMFQKILGVGSWPIWSPLVMIAAWVKPSLSLLPIGHVGSRQWAARNANFASQTLMLAAAAKGIDSCPMEGFSAPKVAKLLGLPRGAVIPVVIALGYRAKDARLEDQWRRPMSDIVVSH